MNLLTQKVLNTIIDNHEQAIQRLNIESFDVYTFLNEQFKTTEDITKNYLFQFVFRSFYRLDNAGLTPELKSRYFELLQEYRNKPIDLKAICLDLSNFKTRKDLNSIQFSFATKLANTIDCNYPIYDSEVIRLFNFKQPYYLKDKNEKIDKYLEQYDHILFTTKELILNEEINIILNSLNNFFGESSAKMGKIKKLDTLMWGVGKVLNENKNKFI
ncbi:hypothetical protein PT447_10890 [Aliarcobacter butzleri]|uniref:hypothetical protein n=1 Tax=Aliarcobacter butzleri TaxID=28197 RepID=UPI0024DE8388|nr:hypothetical protein [Aliarcobacter butzleri]MDK2065432.1 hypothetical protein [Aliarcobacter butzleri]